MSHGATVINGWHGMAVNVIHEFGPAALATAIMVLSLGAAVAKDQSAVPVEMPLPPPRPSAAEPVQPRLPDVSPPNTNQTSVDSCLEQLRRIGVKAESVADIAEGACHANHVVRLFSVANHVILAPPATLRCSMAETVARWSNDIFQDSAPHILGEVPRTILIGTSYACRTQNSQADVKLSEHAFANALDVMGFALSDNRTLMIGAALDVKQALFATEIRRKACLYFSTVLGPGSDVEHGNHLHVDLRERRGNFRICQ
jgi:hypothetical protein